MKTLWFIVSVIGGLLFGGIFGIASVVLLWFIVSLIRICWAVPFGDNAGRLVSGLVVGSVSHPLPDAAGWLLIASLIVVVAHSVGHVTVSSMI